MLAASPKPFALEVQYSAFRRELKMCGDGGGDVVASVSTFARFACARGEAFAVTLDAFDGVGRAGGFVCDGVVSELGDANQRLDGACFVDCLFEFGGCGELNHVLVSPFSWLLPMNEILTLE